MTAARSIDTAPHPDFPIYSAGNFAEVAPSRWSIMSWSLIGDPVERALRGFTRRLVPGARWATGSHYVFVGYFACRPYHNLSALCRLAREAPGLKADDLTAAYFENAPAPPVEGRRSTRLGALGAIPRMVRELGSLRPRLASLEARVLACEQRVSAALHGGSALALGRVVEESLGILDEVWDVHYSTTNSLVPLAAVQRALGRRVLASWGEIEPLVNRPAELAWGRLYDGAASGVLDSTDFLRAAFYEVADAHEPWREYARRFVSSPGAKASAPEGEDLARVVWEMNPGLRLLGLEQLSRAMADTMETREESKALAMRCLHIFRRMLPELAREAGVGGDAWSYLRIGELLAPELAPALPELCDRRRGECETALASPMPDELTTVGPVARARGARTAAGAQRRSVGVSPGVVNGIVVRLADGAAARAGEPDGDLLALGTDDPVILVCESADANIQTLLPRIGGLVTARGSILSHVSILVREYGIPAVVNHPLASTLCSGQRVLLNGSTGEIEVSGEIEVDSEPPVGVSNSTPGAPGSGAHCGD